MAATVLSQPILLSGEVVHGAGRGGTQLGFPTANIDASRIQDAIKDLDDGVYFGYSKVVGKDDSAQPMVMSIGQNITFADAKNKTAEIHVLKTYSGDFYSSTIQAIIVGYIRPMKKFSGLDELIEAINTDIKLAREKMEDPDVSKQQNNSFFLGA